MTTSCTAHRDRFGDISYFKRDTPVMKDRRFRAHSHAATAFYKPEPNSQYFIRLVEKIAEIKLSDVSISEKIRGIFHATSFDYNPKSDEAQAFFAALQNKFYFGITGMAAGDIVISRLDPSHPTAGLTRFDGEKPTVSDAKVAKNYLSPIEQKQLALLSEQFVAIAEIKALRGEKIVMRDWLLKLDRMLSLNDLGIMHEMPKTARDEINRTVSAQMQQYKDSQKRITGVIRHKPEEDGGQQLSFGLRA